MVVMPVFNEQASIAKVIHEWYPILEKTARNFTLLTIDDGSSDGTLEILKSLKFQLGDRLEILSRPNCGHGQSCIQGYRVAIQRNNPYILQIDSDGQSNPTHFSAFWEKRDQFDVIYGKRTRQDGIRRIIASAVLRTALLLVAKVNCTDANVPYRLMKTAACASAIASVPEAINLANIALAVILRRDPAISHGAVPITFPPRYGGEPSVPFSKFAAKAVELFQQVKAFDSGRVG